MAELRSKDMRDMMNKQFNELIVLGEKARKRGGSMAAVFKLIEELLDFEEKIQACMDAQEMTENKSKIESFMSEIDNMYDVLFEMARGGISEIRNERSLGVRDEEAGVGPSTEMEETIEVEPESSPEPEIEEKIEVSKPAASLSVPKIPKMI